MMGKPKSNAIRKLAIEHHKNGKSNRQIFDILLGKAHKNTIRTWIREYKETGKVFNSIPTGRPRSVTTHLNVKRVKRLIRTHSQRQISYKLKISLGSVANIVKQSELKVIK